VVKEKKIEEVGPEWRAFSREERTTGREAGFPHRFAMHDMAATVIGGINKDASGKSCRPR